MIMHFGQDLRGAVALTVAVMSVCDMFLNPTPQPDLRKILEDTLQHLTSSYGITKVDIGNVSVPRMNYSPFTFSVRFLALRGLSEAKLTSLMNDALKPKERPKRGKPSEAGASRVNPEQPVDGKSRRRENRKKEKLKREEKDGADLAEKKERKRRKAD